VSTFRGEGQILIVTFLNVLFNSKPLGKEEMKQVAKTRRRSTAMKKYQFHSYPIEASAAEKSAMRAAGEFVDADIPYEIGPSTVAGLLKSKKHEWIVIAFIRNERFFRMWWNKGPDKESVWPFLAGEELRAEIARTSPTAVAVFHNHPNPNPSLYSMSSASTADLVSAEILKSELEGMGICLLEFVCERGNAHLYYASFKDSLVPFKPISDDVKFENSQGIFATHSLRNELQQSARTPPIPGEDTD
jgi:hypothetical protein